MGRPCSEETKRKISAANKGRQFSDEHRKKLSEARKGQRLSEERKRKISEALKGRKHGPMSEETKCKLSESHKGLEPWNKGATGVYSEETLCQMSKAHKDQTPWHKGRTGVYSDETLCRMSESHKGQVAWNKGLPASGMSGKHLSEEHKARISEANTGRIVTKEQRQKISAALSGRKLSKEVRSRVSEGVRRAWANGVFDDVSFQPQHDVVYHGIEMRSTWESRLAAAFDALNWEWEYEAHKFQYELEDGSHTYTPDFYVPEIDCHFDPHWSFRDDWGKFPAVRAQHNINLIVLDEQLLKSYELAAGIGVA